MGDTNHSWEYNAPQFVDFNSPNALDLNDQADEWFDQRLEPEENFFSLPSEPSAAGSTADNKAGNDENEHPADTSVYYDMEGQDDVPGANVPTDSDTFPVDKTGHTPPKKRQRRFTRTSTSSVASHSSTVSVPTRISNLVTSWGGTVKKTIPSEAKLRRSRRASLQEARAKMHSRVARKSSGKLQKTSEDLELERIEVLRKRADKTMKQSQKSLNTALSSTGVKRPLSTSQVTRPNEFKFRTDERLKFHPMETRKDSIRPSDFAKLLRSKKAASIKQSKGPTITVPKPFHLSQAAEKSKRDGGYQFHSAAEKVIRFQRDTPERFRTKAKNDSFVPAQAHINEKPKTTLPQTPNLMARNRKRPNTAISAAELEEREAEEMKRFRFHAQPVNSRILEKECSLPRVEHKASTRPVGFDLETERRPNRQPVVEEEKFEFKAQPVPRNILEGAIGIRKAEPAALTIPASPSFVWKSRQRTATVMEPENDENDRIVRAHPIPHHGVSFQPKIDHRTTVPEPFSFEERNKQKQKEKEDKIQEMIEEELKGREFHAQPLPDHDAHDHIPKMKAKPVTKPQPFNLESVQRAAAHQEELDRQRVEELREQQSLTAFKAKPNMVTQKEPFVPKRGYKPLTEINAFELHTDRRAVEREEYEERKHERETTLEMMTQERLHREEEEERANIAKARQEMVHKAQPVKLYKPVTIHPSDRSLTHPQSPNFSDRLRK